MTRAQENMAALINWVAASSAAYKTPIGFALNVVDWTGGHRDGPHEVMTDVGPWAVFFPRELNLAPGDVPLDPEHLPLWIPASQVVTTTPFPTQLDSPPASQIAMAYRLLHLLWMFEDGRFKGALIPLTDRTEPLQAALDHHAPGLDLDSVATVFVPLWDLSGSARASAERRLPLVRQ